MEHAKRRSKNVGSTSRNPKSVPQSDLPENDDKINKGKVPMPEKSMPTGSTGKVKKSLSATAVKSSKNPDVGPQPSPSSTAHRIPQIQLSSRAPTSADSSNNDLDILEKKPSWSGDIIIPANFKSNECQKIIGQDGECISELPKGQVSDIGLTGTEERAVDLGDKLYIFGGYRDKFLYLFGSQVSSEAKRKDFTIFLRTSGILQLISKFILAFHDMTFRPPPEQAMEFMLKSMGSKLIIRDVIREMKAYRNEEKLRVEKLILESEELRLRLENYEPVISYYEVLDSDDFEHLAAKKSEAIIPSNLSASIKFTASGSLFATNSDNRGSAEYDFEEEEIDEDTLEADENQKNLDAEEMLDAEAFDERTISLKFVKSIKMERKDRSSREETQKQYAAMAKIEREDLDVDGLFEYFYLSSALDLTDKNDPKRGSIGSCSKLPPLEVKKENPNYAELSSLKMPPLVVTQHRKYMAGTKTFRHPPGKLLKSS